MPRFCRRPCPAGAPPSQEGQQLMLASPSLASGQTLGPHGLAPEALVFAFFAQGRGSVLSPSQPPRFGLKNGCEAENHEGS